MFSVFGYAFGIWYFGMLSVIRYVFGMFSVFRFCCSKWLGLGKQWVPPERSFSGGVGDSVCVWSGGWSWGEGLW